MGVSIGFDVFAKDRASNTFDRVGDSADHSSRRLAKWGKAAKLAGAAMAAGTAVAGVAAVKLAKSAMEDEKSARSMAIAFRNNAGASKAQISATEDWISAQGRALGVADDDLRPALTKLVAATHDVGRAQRLASLAMDVSVGTGKDLGTVSAALAKAQNGNVGGLARLGIATKDAAGKTKTFAQLQKDLADTFKGQAAGAAETAAGKYDRLKLALSEAGESIGYKLLPVASQVANTLVSKGLPALDKFTASAGKLGGPVVSKLKSLKAAFPGSALGGQLAKTGSALAGFGKQMLPTLTSLGNQLKGTLGTGLKQIGSVVSTQFLPAFRRILPVLAPVAKFMLKLFGGAVIGALKGGFQVIKGVLQTVSGLFNTVAALIHGDWSGVWKGLKQTVSGLGNVVVGAIKVWWNVGILATFKRGVVFLTKGIWVKLWSGLKTGAKTGLTAVGGAAKSGIAAIGRFFLAGIKGYLRIWVNGFKVLRSAFGGAWAPIRSVVSQSVGAIVGAARGAIGRVAGAFGGLKGKVLGALSGVGGWLKGIGRNLVEGLKNGISGAWHLVTSAVTNLVNKIPKKVRDLLGIASPSKVMMRLGSWTTEGFAAGLIGRGWQKASSALTRIRDRISGWKDDLASLIGDRDSFAAGFNWSESLFGADYGDRGPTLSTIFAQQEGELRKAQQVQADVAKLLGAGLSEDLINQMQAGGSGGIAALHALAGGSTADIARANANNGAINAAYGAAGMGAANRIYGGQIGTAQAKVAEAERLEAAFTRALGNAKANVVINLEGKQIVQSVALYEKKKGKKK